MIDFFTPYPKVFAPLVGKKVMKKELGNLKHEMVRFASCFKSYA